MSHVELSLLHGFIVTDSKLGDFFVDRKHPGPKLCRFGTLGYRNKNSSILFTLIDVREATNFFQFLWSFKT